MLPHYLRVATRLLRRRKGYAAINLLGLALGLATSLVLLQFVRQEQQYDAFHEDADQLYRVRMDAQRPDALLQAAVAFAGVGPAMHTDLPEVEAFARLTRRYGGGVIRYGDRAFRETAIFHADASVLTLFSFPLAQGDPATALAAPNTAVLSQAAARRYFGDTDPMGQRLRFGPREEYVVTGVLAEAPPSHLQFDFLFSYPSLAQLWQMDLATDWRSLDFLTYVRLQPGTDPAQLEAALPAFLQRYRPEAADRMHLRLQPVQDIHLHSDYLFEAGPNGDAQTVAILAAVALAILILAWANYLNLTTARAIERAKEIGVRKVAGARRSQLVRQLLLESLLMHALACLGAWALVQVLLPLFNQMTGAALAFTLTEDPAFWLGFGGLLALGALITGGYPAWLLSSFAPLRVLKGRFGHQRQGMSLRQALVVLQFAATVALLAGAGVVYQQVTFMQAQPLGIDIAQTVVVETPGVVGDNAAFTHQFEGFKAALRGHPHVQQVATSSEVPGTQDPWMNSTRRLGATADEQAELFLVSVDYDYLGSYSHARRAGRFLSEAFPADAHTSVVLNERAVAVLGLGTPEEALGEALVMRGDTLTVVGVVGDHHQQGLHEAQYQMAFRVMPEEYRYFSIRLAGQDVAETLAALEATYARFFPEAPFTYRFLDQIFDQQYRVYQQFGHVVGFFAGLAIVVACLGLLGLATLYAAQRTKEIGIRKVLGASRRSLLLLLAQALLKLVLLGSLLALPMAWLLMDRWLTDFAYRIDLGGWPFFAAFGLTLLLAFLSIGYQTLRAATANPIQALRYE